MLLVLWMIESIYLYIQSVGMGCGVEAEYPFCLMHRSKVHSVSQDLPLNAPNHHINVGYARHTFSTGVSKI